MSRSDFMSLLFHLHVFYRGICWTSWLGEGTTSCWWQGAKKNSIKQRRRSWRHPGKYGMPTYLVFVGGFYCTEFIWLWILYVSCARWWPRSLTTFFSREMVEAAKREHETGTKGGAMWGRRRKGKTRFGGKRYDMRSRSRMASKLTLKGRYPDGDSYSISQRTLKYACPRVSYALYV